MAKAAKKRQPRKRAVTPVESGEGGGFEFELLSAKALSPRETSIGLFLGPPKTGKSSALAGICQEAIDAGKKAMLIATLRREVTSWGYQEIDDDVLDVVLLEDKGWDPLNGEFNPTAFRRFLDLMDALAEDDEYKVILIDNGTEVGEFAWHYALEPFGVASPGDMEDKDNRFRPYTKLADYMQQALDKILGLKTAPTPKHVGIAWHVQPTKENTTQYDKSAKSHVQKVSADNIGKGVEFEGDVLPMLQGGFRRKIAGLTDYVVYTHVHHEYPTSKKGVRVPGSKKRPRYALQVAPDEERHASVPGPVPDEPFIYATPGDPMSMWRELRGLFTT